MHYSVVQHYHSLESFNGDVNGWDAQFGIPDVSRFQARIRINTGPGSTMTEGTFAVATSQRGSTPRGMRTFALPLRLEAPILWRNSQVDQTSLMVFGEDRELFALAPGASQILTVSIDAAVVARQLADWGADDQAGLAGARVSKLPDTTYLALRRCLSIYGGMLSKGLSEHRPDVFASLQEDLLTLFAQRLVTTALEATAVSPDAAAHHVRRAMDYLATHRREPLTATQLAQTLGASRRTLEKSFRRYLGCSPKQFILEQRLLGCRQELGRKQPGDTNVSTIAFGWGFWHLGQFAADYRQRFGELPSATLARPASRQPNPQGGVMERVHPLG